MWGGVKDRSNAQRSKLTFGHLITISNQHQSGSAHQQRPSESSRSRLGRPFRAVLLLLEHSSCHWSPMAFSADGVITTHWLRMGYLEHAHLRIHHPTRTRGEVTLNAVIRHRLRRLQPATDTDVGDGVGSGELGKHRRADIYPAGGVRRAHCPAAQAEGPGRSAP